MLNHYPIQIENEKENAKGTDIENGKKRSCERDIVTENGRDTVELQNSTEDESERKKKKVQEENESRKGKRRKKYFKQKEKKLKRPHYYAWTS